MVARHIRCQVFTFQAVCAILKVCACLKHNPGVGSSS